MTRYESNPSAAFISVVSFAAHSNVGSHRDSRVSVRQKTASCSFTNASSLETSPNTRALSCDATGCPGIGTDIVTPTASTPGKTRFRFAAAASAFNLPPSRQSLNSNSDWRTGLEKETTPESTNVNEETPHPRRHRATAHPSVPAPTIRHRVSAIFFRSRSGSKRHRMSFRLSSAAAIARRVGSMLSPRSARRGPARPFGFNSQPTTGKGQTCVSEKSESMLRRFLRVSDIVPSGKTSSNTTLCSEETRPVRLRTLSTERRLSSPRSKRAAASVVMLRNAQPGWSGFEHGSRKERYTFSSESSSSSVPSASLFSAFRCLAARHAASIAFISVKGACVIFRAPVSCDTRVAHANAGFVWSRKFCNDSASSSSTRFRKEGAVWTAALVLSAGKQNQYEKVQLFKSANVKTRKGTSKDGSSNASPETTLRQSSSPASFCIATRSKALNRSNVLTLRSEPGMRMRPDAVASPAVADHTSNARRSSCAGEETSLCVAHANCASTGTESSLRPKVSSLRRASSAQNVGSTALCQGSNRSTSVAGAPGEGGALGSDIAPNAASRELDARGRI
mmetsp:Transcript_9205/g.39005  ORF Transcript_9205/g.39005 Transcript_9205/m.39005 type:complete len:565 (+) Transcript_9205:772-2466(+)